MPLHGQTALVTGASRGIGRGIALAIGRRGARVIGTATGSAGLQAICAMFEREGIDGRAELLDVADPQAAGALVGRLDEQGLSPSILVNNAGITRDNLLLRMKDEEWQSIIDTNLTSVYRLCKSVLRAMMKARYGRIVNITSVVGQSGNAGQTNYAAAKAGVIGFTKSLAREIGSRGVTVNAVAPGFIDTDMTRALSDAQRDALLAQIPLGRLGAIEEVAAAVTFLASPDAGYITGETLSVNGGMYMA
ncbi:MAG: 3-oxoacyl-ACP reductase FabG [Gammaproteobacteria bacterium]|nr:3-oxoacyl-ACP reductase FabG [Gammaproteobacteria bacterium]